MEIKKQSANMWPLCFKMNKCKNCGHDRGEHLSEYSTHNGCFHVDEIMKKEDLCDCKQFIPNNSSLDSPLLDKDPESDTRKGSIMNETGSDFILSDKINTAIERWYYDDLPQELNIGTIQLMKLKKIVNNLNAEAVRKLKEWKGEDSFYKEQIEFIDKIFGSLK